MVAVELLEVCVVVQGQQSEELREGFHLLRDALPRPQLGEHTHSHPEHGGPIIRWQSGGQFVRESQRCMIQAVTLKTKTTIGKQGTVSTTLRVVYLSS